MTKRKSDEEKKLSAEQRAEKRRIDSEKRALLRSVKTLENGTIPKNKVLRGNSQKNRPLAPDMILDRDRRARIDKNLDQHFFGDPLPGCSALDQKLANGDPIDSD